MTKKELKQALLDFIQKHDDTYNNEWYCTAHSLAESFIENLAADLKIDLYKEYK